MSPLPIFFFGFGDSFFCEKSEIVEPFPLQDVCMWDCYESHYFFLYLFGCMCVNVLMNVLDKVPFLKESVKEKNKNSKKQKKDII